MKFHLSPSVLALLFPVIAAAATLRVPADQPTIQAAIDQAREGDTVLIAPGIYRESLVLGNKSLTLASHFLSSRDPADIDATVLDATTPEKKRGASLLVIEKTVAQPAKIVGLTFQGASHAVSIHGAAEVSHNRFVDNGDALSFESGRGEVRFNTFENNGDDGIDMDGASAGLIEDNIIRNNRDDGIEVRLHPYEGPPSIIVIRRNLIAGNGEDGLQLIDYPGKSPRVFRVERNIFSRNAMAGLGCMPDGNTRENYGGAAMLERVHVLNNTFAGSAYGLTGGDNLVVLNNVFMDMTHSALKRVQGDSAAGKNLLWHNGADFEDCDLAEHAFVTADPKFDEHYRPQAASPCIDAGETKLDFNGETLTLTAEFIRGRAPDLGATEAEPSP